MNDLRDILLGVVGLVAGAGWLLVSFFLPFFLIRAIVWLVEYIRV